MQRPKTHESESVVFAHEESGAASWGDAIPSSDVGVLAGVLPA